MILLTTIAKDGSVRLQHAKRVTLRKGKLTITTNLDTQWKPGFLSMVLSPTPHARSAPMRSGVGSGRGW
jgi:ribosomal protein RSM22 (predicted rRNA methylase)